MQVACLLIKRLDMFVFSQCIVKKKKIWLTAIAVGTAYVI
jgi:hypothetical protein